VLQGFFHILANRAVVGVSIEQMILTVGVGIAMDEFCHHALGMPRLPMESPFMGLPMDFLEDGMCPLCLFSGCE